MEKYVKIVDNELVYLSKIPQMSNPSAITFEKWALANGYKRLISVPKPHNYCVLSYSNLKSSVKEKWADMPLEIVKGLHIEKINNALINALSTRAKISVDGLGDFVYDSDAVLNILGLLMLKGTEINVEWINANDELIILDTNAANKLSEAFEKHKEKIYEMKIAKMTKVAEANTVSAINAIDLNFNINTL